MRRLLPVTGNWGTLLTALIPLALVIAVSPLTIIPAVLVLHAPRPRPTGLAFLGGWVLGLCVLTGIFVTASGAMAGLHKSPPAWASWLRVVLGSVLILFGIYRWFSRHRESEAPRWMRAFDTITPKRAAVTAAVLTVLRPEVSLLCVAAGLAIGTNGLGPVGRWVAGGVFVAISASTVAIPILAYVAAGDRLDEPLERLKEWMQKNHAAMLAAVLVLIGLMVLYNGLSALT
ncbi:GAP family protein [Mycobacterium sp. ML4]